MGRGSRNPGHMSHLVVLDNEAVQALTDPDHPKHRHVLSHVQVVADRKRRALPISLTVPTAIRVEAGWDRTSTEWAFLNRLRIADVPLDAAYANAAADIRNRTRVSVADAHAGAVIQASQADQITVITSDPTDMRRVAGDSRISIVTV
jgi:predicted nucleic acid-binding protein